MPVAGACCSPQGPNETRGAFAQKPLHGLFFAECGCFIAQANAPVDTSFRGILADSLVDKVYEGYLLVFLADTLGISEIFGKLSLSLSVNFYLHNGVGLN